MVDRLLIEDNQVKGVVTETESLLLRRPGNCYDRYVMRGKDIDRPVLSMKATKQSTSDD